jgi:translation initiation factor eIF-2B subunit alpha/methylthioribose-1-phosphate isomerase
MLVKTREGAKDYRTLWMEETTVNMIDQRMLPHKFEVYRSKDHRDTVSAIRNMIVRGAPAIGAAAAYAVAQAASEYRISGLKDFEEHMNCAAAEIKRARPTAYDLFYAVDSIMEKLGEADSPKEAKEKALEESRLYADRSADACKKIGEYGMRLIVDGSSILTHCNAGALACVDYGTALSPIRLAHRAGKNIRVFVDETRPRLQGAKLTAWELSQEDIPYVLIADNAAGYFMEKGEIDLVLVGADRVTGDGDVFNKIGTYEKAVVAKENGIPFYVAAPESSFDAGSRAEDVEVEERSGDEVIYMEGARIAPQGCVARNPAFDVTPKRYVSGFITEKGIRKNR